MALILVIVSVIITIATIVYLAIKHRYQYWARRGIPFVKPVFPMGVQTKRDGKRIGFQEILSPIYQEFKGFTPLCGVIALIRPIAIALDLDLINSILIKDFVTFHERGFYYNERDDPLSAHLFSLSGSRWKTLRAKLTPTFTSGKMKFMYPTVVQVANEMNSTLAELAKSDGAIIEVKDLLARFTTDIIGTCAFGIECNSLRDPKSEFREFGKKSVGAPRNGFVKRVLAAQFPNLARRMHIKTIREEVSEFIVKVVTETLEFREKNGIRRNDFMDLLIELKNGGRDGIERLTLNEIAAQVFLFFLAEFETASATLTFALYELALNPEVQDRARLEIQEVLKKHNGKFTYDAMMDMHYIDAIINESLRKYPPFTTLRRRTDQNYAVPGTNYILEEGTSVLIPVFSIHRDPEIYSDPERFNPDRFKPEEVKKRHPMSFLGFGDGPRSCIGSRFGQIQTRVGLVVLLRSYRLKTCDKTLIPMRFSTSNPILAPDGGLWLKIEKV